MADPGYRRTAAACWLGIVTQAVSANFVPLLFLTFRAEFGLSLEQVAVIPTLFFFTQLVTDFLCAKGVDRIGYRRCIVAAEAFSALGLAGLTFLPQICGAPFAGILVCVIVYAVGSGLIEVLVSPIIEACPFENKDRAMALLHSFYCWGSVAVILGSTVFFAVFGVDSWRVLALLWALLPLCNILNFVSCPIDHTVDAAESMSMSGLFRTPVFWLLMLLMVCAGASELAMAQWASAFTESALGVTKTVGDLAGPCLFAVLMGLCRVLYGRMSGRAELSGILLVSGAACVVCYLLASLAESPVLGLAGCALCGFTVGVMWPGTIRIASGACPRGGTAMFALLALAGDLGGAAGPALVGTVSSAAGDAMKQGLLAAAVFPAVLVLSVLRMRRRRASAKAG